MARRMRRRCCGARCVGCRARVSHDRGGGAEADADACVRVVATLYALAKRLARTVGVPLRLDGRGAARKRDNVPAELALMGAVVAVLKLVYGLDGTARCVCPRCSARVRPLTTHRHVTGNDPGCAMPRLGEYLARLAARAEPDDV